MPFDKPKVTIDLEEYNELIKAKDEAKGDEYVIMAKTVVAAILNSRMNPAAATEALKRAGIHFSATTGMGIDYAPDGVHIQKIQRK